jgi:hypothetical protein
MPGPPWTDQSILDRYTLHRLQSKREFGAARVRLRPDRTAPMGPGVCYRLILGSRTESSRGSSQVFVQTVQTEIVTATEPSSGGRHEARSAPRKRASAQAHLRAFGVCGG